MASSAYAGDRPAAFRPTDANVELIEFSEAVKVASRSRQRPPQLDEIRALIALAIDADDTRLLGHAQARLAPLRAQAASAVEADFLVAWIAQHRHDFDGATALLDAVLARDPRHLGALRTRAFIAHALGKNVLVRSHCVALALAGDRDYATLCSALWMYGDGRTHDAVALITPLLSTARERALRDELTRLIAELELARQAPAAARAALDTLENMRPGDLRTRLRAEIELGVVTSTLPATDASDEALFLRALAATRAGSEDAAARRDLFLARLAERERSGDTGCFGLASEYYLDVAPDPALAREYALRHLATTGEPRAHALAKRAGVQP